MFKYLTKSARLGLERIFGELATRKFPRTTVQQAHYGTQCPRCIRHTWLRIVVEDFIHRTTIQYYRALHYLKFV